VATQPLTKLQYFYWDEILYILSLGLIKISILLFYLRIFPQKPFRKWVYVLIGLNVCYCIAFSLTMAFQCTPVSGAWLAWSGEFQAQCVNINYIGWSGAAVGIVFDVATIFLPIPQLVGLNMSLKKKLQVSLMFVVGLL
jgi:hypothetical protein